MADAAKVGKSYPPSVRKLQNLIEVGGSSKFSSSTLDTLGFAESRLSNQLLILDWLVKHGKAT